MYILGTIPIISSVVAVIGHQVMKEAQHRTELRYHMMIPFNNSVAFEQPVNCVRGSIIVLRLFIAITAVKLFYYHIFFLFYYCYYYYYYTYYYYDIIIIIYYHFFIIMLLINNQNTRVHSIIDCFCCYVVIDKSFTI